MYPCRGTSSRRDFEGEVLTCPWHYSRFKITDGSVINGPAKKPLNVYRYEIKDGQMLLELKDKDKVLYFMICFKSSSINVNYPYLL